MKTRTVLVIITVTASIALAAASPVFSAVSAAPAAQGAQPPAGVISPTPGPNTGETADQQGPRRKALERLFAREQEWLARQETNLGKADAVNAKVEELISRIEARGLDPAPIRQALQAFNTSIAGARRDHLKAKAILTIHAGFNDHGSVLNLGEATETVRTAGSNLKSASQTMRQASRALVQAIRDFRQAHPLETPVEPASPE